MFIAIKTFIQRLFGKNSSKPEKPAPEKHGERKLNREDKRQIEAAIAKAKRTDKNEMSAQDSIPYQRMFPNGVCRVTDTFYTRTIQFQDINYQLSQNEDKAAIFEGWCDLLNCATRSRTNTILQGVKLCGRKDHMVVKAGGLQRQTKATTYTLKSGMMG